MDNKKELLSQIKVLEKMADSKEIVIVCDILKQMINETNKGIMGFKHNENSD